MLSILLHEVGVMVYDEPMLMKAKRFKAQSFFIYDTPPLPYEFTIPVAVEYESPFILHHETCYAVIVWTASWH